MAPAKILFRELGHEGKGREPLIAPRQLDGAEGAHAGIDEVLVRLRHRGRDIGVLQRVGHGGLDQALLLADVVA